MFPYFRTICSDRFLGSEIRERIRELILSEESEDFPNSKKRADSDMKISFSMYPTSITELFDVADQELDAAKIDLV